MTRGQQSSTRNLGVSSRPIIFVQPHLEFGGAERQTVLLANSFAESGEEVHVVLFEARGGLLPTLSGKVAVHDLGLESHGLLPLVAIRLRKKLEELPAGNVIIKLWSGILATALIAPFSKKHNLIYTEDLDPREHAKYVRLGSLKQAIVKRVFRSAAHVVANSELIAKAMTDVYRLDHLPKVVYPSISIEEIRSPALRTKHDWVIKCLDEEPRKLTVASTGSLKPLKGLDITRAALEALEIELNWLVIGEGELASEIAGWSTDRIRLIHVPATPRPYDLYANVDVLVHSSRSEAFGIVLIEALATGTPVIASNTLGAQVISDHMDGSTNFATYTVDDVQGLAEQLRILLERVGKRGVEPDQEELFLKLDSFTIAAAHAAWMAIFEQIQD